MMEKRNNAPRILSAVMVIAALIFAVSCESGSEMFMVSWEGIEMAPVAVKGGEAYTVPEVPVKRGYEAVIRTGDRTVAPGESVEITGNTVFRLGYVVAGCTVTFEGADVAPMHVDAFSTVVIPRIPAKTGMVTVITVNGERLSAFSELEIVEDTVVKISYETLSYSVSWKGIDRPDDRVGEDGIFTVPADLPQRDGMKMTIMNGNRFVKPGDRIKLRGDIVLVCQYSRDNSPVARYTVSYTVDGDRTVRLPEYMTEGEDYIVPDDLPVSTDEMNPETVINIGGKIYLPGERITVNGDMEVVVTYAPEIYTVSFKVPEGWDPIAPVRCLIGDEVSVPPVSSMPVREGYDLKLYEVIEEVPGNTEGGNIPIFSDTVFEYIYEEASPVNIQIRLISPIPGQEERIENFEKNYNELYTVPYMTMDGCALQSVMYNGNTCYPGDVVRLTDPSYDFQYIFAEGYHCIFRIFRDGKDTGIIYPGKTVTGDDDAVIGCTVPVELWNEVGEEERLLSITDEIGNTVNPGEAVDFGDRKDMTFIVDIRKPSAELVITVIEDHAEVNGYTGTDEFVVIPDHVGEPGGTVPVTELSSLAFRGNETVRNIALPETLETIGMNAFEGCSALETITCGSGSRFSMEGNCLIHSEKVNGADTRTLIKGFGDSVIPAGTDFILRNAFDGTGLRDFTIPKSVRDIQTAAFRGCSAEDLVIPSGVNVLDSWVFAEGEYGTVHIHRDVVSIMTTSFEDSTIRKIDLDPGNINFRMEDGYLVDVCTGLIVAHETPQEI